MTAFYPVTEKDREAYLRLNMLPLDLEAVHAGRLNNTNGMQVLARHRTEALEEAERVIRTHPMRVAGCTEDHVRAGFAAAIEALKGQP